VRSDARHFVRLIGRQAERCFGRGCHDNATSSASSVSDALVDDSSGLISVAKYQIHRPAQPPHTCSPNVEKSSAWFNQRCRIHPAASGSLCLVTVLLFERKLYINTNSELFKNEFLLTFFSEFSDNGHWDKRLMCVHYCDLSTRHW